MPTVNDLKKYVDKNSCSLEEANKVLRRREFCHELRTDNNLSELADTLIRILDFEFTDANGWDR